jgi:hypothetical protein
MLLWSAWHSACNIFMERFLRGRNGVQGRARGKRIAGPNEVIMWLIFLVFAGTTLATATVDDAAQLASDQRAAVKTGKERLGSKASDEQRVDDCKVPQAKRTRSRPATCAEK